MYALTLIATIAVPATRLQRWTAGLGERAAADGDPAADADGDVADTLIGQARLCLALLAPLIAGPVANILQAAKSPERPAVAAFAGRGNRRTRGRHRDQSGIPVGFGIDCCALLDELLQSRRRLSGDFSWTKPR